MKPEKTKSDKIRIEISDYINKIDLSNLGLGVFDPAKYYVTSGHAVWKTRKMQTDLQKIKKELSKLKKTKNQIAKMANVTTAIKNAQKLLDHLIELQGDAIFMELEWGSEHDMYVIPKNPRSKEI